MYECLVGYTPFYADDGAATCRRILGWRETLSVPAEVRKKRAVWLEDERRIN